jgi:hypothetical protein
VLIGGLTVIVNAQPVMNFPTNDEISLLISQTERTIQQYRPLVDQEEAQMGKDGTEAASKDRQVIDELEVAIKAFKAQPQRFNGPLGFAFFESLDDADRNIVLCGSGASSQATLQLMTGNTARANSLIELARSCSDADALMYTVSENAASLYERYAEAEAQLATQGVETSEKCMAILKKNSTPPKN